MLKLYKYVPFSEGAKCIISQGTLKFSSCNEFNDPFDCIVEFDTDKARGHLLKRNDLLHKSGALIGLSPAQKIIRKHEFVNKLVGQLERDAFLNDIATKWGVCSLSTTPTNILMWSHYADHHRGFVVEFTTDQNNPKALNRPEYYLLSWPVTYTDDVPVRDISKRDFDSVEQQFLHKATDWKYENEYRCLASKAGVGVHEIDKSMITSVIAGVKMAPERINELRQLISSSGLDEQIIFKQARMKKGKYELELV